MYTFFEQEAELQERGLWAEEGSKAELLALREDERARFQLAQNGLELLVSEASGLVASGTTVTVATNVPAEIFVSHNGEAFRSLSGSLVIESDQSIQFKAVALGTLPTETITDRTYTLLRPHYEGISVTELYPSPRKGQKEWIELQNSGDIPMPLAGWKIVDATGRVKKLGSDLSIEAHSVLVLSGSQLPVSLNNGSDAIRLIDPLGKTGSIVAYAKVKVGQSYAMTANQEFCISDVPTEGQQNTCVTAQKKNKKSVQISIHKNGLKSNSNTTINARKGTPLPPDTSIFSHLLPQRLTSTLLPSAPGSPSPLEAGAALFVTLSGLGVLWWVRRM